MDAHRRGWANSRTAPPAGLPPKPSIIPDIGPDPARCRLAPGQHRHGGIVPVQPFGPHDMGGKPMVQGCEHGRGCTHLVGKGRQAQRHAFTAIALDLPVERLMLPVLLEQHHRQQTWTGPAARHHMERRRGLADLLAVPAGDLLTHRLDDLPLARDHLERLGDVITDPAQPGSPAGWTGAGRRNDTALTWQMLWERLA
ncbi:hypothetical protein SAMN02745223_03094 [Devosia limi DSM 17137]|uniref:Uncharacterized protein n=1 Tax=Devosia limi DSM 17137 TaxID=1121477 RepID=A0A1M5D1Z2_9HYPH|nr:hypothetical protein SAMN02745223_03094 [Devosia limi DSM 17137]